MSQTTWLMSFANVLNLVTTMVLFSFRKVSSTSFLRCFWSSAGLFYRIAYVPIMISESGNLVLLFANICISTSWLICLCFYVLPGPAAYCWTKWNSGTWYCWWKWAMEKETYWSVSEAFWVLTSSNSRTIDAWKRSTWKCSGIYFVICSSSDLCLLKHLLAFKVYLSFLFTTRLPK